ncbi:hypothetical protein C7U92_31925 [Bradyrhizobium sp. WBOS7]|uniref:Uncharacterized protein n=1 Tax=Bradyrhizobium betae TaxID=244734 RepID=A0AAE9N4D4_9BRAD|nr:hypothetical protein [Bradyrhizobium sp. WBOS2]MDD1575076.1 hypothetical protein [Bradyrhizobium sp. WBOS1]MDD1581296.1 hypothetical protein [Bradyrhizobium sp. WBOS7]MDD1604684.1 hypothetical protein [Bradyrhizobium sp. WBOS16]UUO33868.1 hypothetical protein DCK84_04275 [Bradyrhizobium sp. WBOS01]UUO40299.1 hypothetical protein DCM75_05710 [Bradyrhizobium sp. WBOS02]UUO52401.1 hypothetical protein DCM79_04985 [Bradyrhizobium sp. WBOS07]UUO64567.1 hypothetical protein DCM83_04595 [Bradyrh
MPGRRSGLRSCRAGGALPLPLAGEGRGEGVSAMGQSPRGENPHPTRRTMLRIARDASTSPASGRGAAETAFHHPQFDPAQRAPATLCLIRSNSAVRRSFP